MSIFTSFHEYISVGQDLERFLFGDLGLIFKAIGRLNFTEGMISLEPVGEFQENLLGYIGATQRL